uniref:flavin prenyltransferase n=1 Tax=mine drainage metagenome TaxID=410659 RepID=E6QSG3_9ZZZZ
MSQPHNVTLAWTGASGMPYGVRLLEQLLYANVGVYLLVSTAAQIVAKQEMGWTIPAHTEALQAQLAERYAHLPGEVRVFGREAWFAPMASGSNPADAMVICPCTMGTLAAVAQGMSDNLIERAADVCIKEQRKLIVVPRETPYSVLHLENMLKLARMGVVILPPNPGFYHQPKAVEDLVDFVVARILDHLQVPHNLMIRWGE